MLVTITLKLGIKILFLYCLLKNNNKTMINPNNEPRVPVNDHAIKAKNIPKIGNKSGFAKSLRGLSVRYENHE